MKATVLFVSLFIVNNIYAQHYSEFKKATCFIYQKDSVGNPIPNGTGFIVARKIKNDTSRLNLFVVTAQHVLQDSRGNFLKEVFIRMNTKDSLSRYIYVPVDTSSNRRTVFLHNDKSVDIAVIPFGPSKEDYDYKIVPPSFYSDLSKFKSYNLEEGMDAFFVGLFVQFVGENKISPIFRFGKIALVTDEKIMWIGKKRNLFLLEVSSFGGNSGAPVYAVKTDAAGNSEVILLGILSGTFRDVADIQVIQTNNVPVALYNNGVSGVTPSYLLFEILYSNDMIEKYGE